jgi:excisionase family DNA binding protein
VTPETFLTIREVAQLLKLAKRTVYSMARAGELPAFKVRGQWRIRRKDFEKWAARRSTAWQFDTDPRN